VKIHAFLNAYYNTDDKINQDRVTYRETSWVEAEEDIQGVGTLDVVDQEHCYDEALAAAVGAVHIQFYKADIDTDAKVAEDSAAADLR